MVFFSVIESSGELLASFEFLYEAIRIALSQSFFFVRIGVEFFWTTNAV